MSATAAAAGSLAKSQEGYRESPAGSNHTKYGVWYGVDPAFWCAMFMSWVWWSIGLRFSGAQSAKGWASAEMMHQWFVAHGRFTHAPAFMDAVFIHVPGEHAGANHVGFYLGKRSDGWVHLLSGNTSGTDPRNGGMVAEGYYNPSWIIGYGRPPYVTAAPSPSPTTPPTWWHRTQTLTSPYMSGTDVEAAAKRLKAHGFDPGLPLSIFGPMMDKAVRAFQGHVHIVVDGDIGPTTAHYLGG
jgi:hypothetical protein